MVDGSQLAVDLSRRLRAARVISGKSVPELVSDLGEGWSKDKVYRVETGKQVPSAVELVEFAYATGQSIDFFLGSTTSHDRDEDEERVLPLPLPLDKLEPSEDA